MLMREITLCHETAFCHETTVAVSRAARELGLERGEFDAAVELGHVPTVACGVPWRRRVPRRPLDRLLADPRRLDALRSRAQLVDAVAGAQLLGVSVPRLTRLARAGCFCPFDFRVDGPGRHGVLAWRYLAVELCEVATRRPELLAGPVPGELRRAVRAGMDRRARRWRSRRTRLLMRWAGCPWERAAVQAAVLEPSALAAVVPDRRDRRRLLRLRPPLAGVPPRPGHRETVRNALTVRDPEEIRGYCSALSQAVTAARHVCSGPLVAPPSRAGADGQSHPARVTQPP